MLLLRGHLMVQMDDTGVERSAKILRVGGDERDRRVLETVLRGAGYPDVAFVSADEARQAVTAGNADLVVLDLILPSADVFSLLRAAADPASGRPPVIVTAPATANDRIQATLQRGAEDYLITPFDQINSLLVTRPIELALARRALRAAVHASSRSVPDETQVIELYSNASNKFVPKEFLHHLGRSTIAEVQLGDHVQSDMAVLFSDIRDFTMLSEQMTPRENFNFLNSYLRNVTPLIRANHGFIDKYIGDAIMALFPRQSADALQAAVELQRQVRTYNEGRKAAGYVPIRIGIGLHRGDLILGTIGEEARMQTTVIADAVNVASRIEGLTKTFGVDLLVSKAIVDRLPMGNSFHLRHLGIVKAKGKTRTVEVYECFDNDPIDLLQHKQNSAALFAQAVKEYRSGLYLSAGKTFQRVAAQHPQDTVAAYYRDACSMSVLSSSRAGVP